MAIGKPGARNAGILAAQIIATSEAQLAGKLEKFKQEMARSVEKKAKKIENL
jgi:phosphoribosylamine--glycine ligase